MVMSVHCLILHEVREKTALKHRGRKGGTRLTLDGVLGPEPTDLHGVRRQDATLQTLEKAPPGRHDLRQSETEFRGWK